MANFTFRVLWWSLVVSLLVYVLAAHVAALPADPRAPLALLTSIFGTLTAIIAVGTVIYRRRALAGPIQSGQLDPHSPIGLGKAFQPFIINLLLSESVGVYGLVLAFLSGNPDYSVAFTVAALVLMYVHRPTAPDLIPPMSAGSSGNRPAPIT